MGNAFEFPDAKIAVSPQLFANLLRFVVRLTRRRCQCEGVWVYTRTYGKKWVMMPDDGTQNPIRKPDMQGMTGT